MFGSSHLSIKGVWVELHGREGAGAIVFLALWNIHCNLLTMYTSL